MTEFVSAPIPPAALQREQLEMQAFEKGRIQGELEATRRMEAEGMQKQMLPAAVAPTDPALLNRPDVVEINRLTNLQRASFVLGWSSIVATLVLSLVWIVDYKNNVGWSDDYAGDNVGNIKMWNTSFLCRILGLVFLTNAITNYRVFPINMSPMINRAWYIFLQCCTMVCFSVAFAGLVKSTPEATMWAVDDWVWAAGFAICVSHGLYSIIHTSLETMRPRTAEEWEAHKRGDGLLESPEQMRDHSSYNAYGRSVYTAAPAENITMHAPPANLNVDAQLPAAPANAPRWAENPNTHSENYWLLPRAKWAIVGYWSVGVATLMQLAALDSILATGHQNWSQDALPSGDPQMSERGAQAQIIGATGLLLLASLAFISYMAMPPRTTLVKNGILQDPNARRGSVSQNAPTVTMNPSGHNYV